MSEKKIVLPVAHILEAGLHIERVREDGRVFHGISCPNAVVDLLNLSGELAELLRELSNAKGLTFPELENRVGSALARFDAIAEVKR